MTDPQPRSNDKSDWLLLGLLLLLVLPLRLWLLYNTEVAARDSIGYIRYALRFEHESWQQVLQTSQQHPGYPMLVWLASQPVRWYTGETTPENMQLSAQLISFVASLLLILPMYFLGKQFFPARISFFATLLYQYLPISAQHLSDGVSEPAYLLLLTTGLLQAVRAIRQHNVWRSILCGLFAGAAYWIRPEGMLLLPAFVLVLLALQYPPQWRRSWKQTAASGLASVLAVSLIASAYVITTGRITPKLSALEILRNLKLLADEPSGHDTVVFATTFQKIDNKMLRLQRSVWALFAELNQGFHYVASLFALLGLLWSFGQIRRDPGLWLLLVFSFLHSFILVALAMSVSYVSDRHVMILVLCGCYFVVLGMEELVRRVLAWRNSSAVQVGFAILFLALIAFCLPRATQRLHGNRAGNRQAGLWLAQQLKPGDIIRDDHDWSNYFAGEVLREHLVPVYSRNLKATCYVVITRSRDGQIDAKRQAQVGADAAVVYVWPENEPLRDARVIVYAQQRVFEENPWHLP